MNLSRNQIIIIGIAAIIVIVFILIFLGVIPGLQQNINQKAVQLAAFGVEDEKVFDSLIENYGKIQAGVKITYYQFSKDDFEKKLLEALAAGRGPDIISFHSSWLPKHQNKIVPAPSTQISLNQVKQLFPQVVEQNFVSAEKIYALPLYIDTLVMLYNKDIFDAKTIALPPRTWIDFQALVPKLREINSSNQIVKSAAAIGGSSKSIDQASDLLNLLIMQFGGPRITSQNEFRFDKAGSDAFNFYLSFTNPLTLNYTWDDNLFYSLDSFSQGKTAVIFNYNSAIPVIKSKNAFLNLGIAPMPQLAGASQPINQADYWGLAVTNQSQNSAWAWDFIINVASKSEIADAYSQATGESPALRSLVSKYIDDPKIGVFASQALTARSWGEPDKSALNQIFSNMIESVLNGRLTQSQAISQAEEEINSAR